MHTQSLAYRQDWQLLGARSLRVPHQGLDLKVLLTGSEFVFQGIRGEPGELISSSPYWPWSTVGRRPNSPLLKSKVLFTRTVYNTLIVSLSLYPRFDYFGTIELPIDIH